ncbi:c-type cytochrome [Limnobacter sp. 130]|uniref:c-type cytochrome n=1 Tax=unclassified Limnobacter TaxID=2630203 RepID=UPI0012F3295C|nr:c-type cytochrome [Limnobacter sp. 130]VWX35457.1 Cytochrome c553-like protein [Limnobacter sp. 130]
MTDLKQHATRLLMSMALAGSGLLLGTGALANELTPEKKLQAASLAATCANCHGTNGVGVQGSAVTGLANLSVEYIKTNMIWFKTGQRPATVMHQLAKGYTDEQIDIIANYLGKKD